MIETSKTQGGKISDYANLSDQQLNFKIKELVGKERVLTQEIIEYLAV